MRSDRTFRTLYNPAHAAASELFEDFVVADYAC
jgi:hypothetical protein